MRFLSQGWRGWLWPVVLAGVIVLASSQSRVTAPSITGFDKVTHFFVYGLLATLVARNGFVPRFGWLAVLLVSVFGATDEWHQYYTPGRSAEVADWLADTLGALVAVTVYARWTWYRETLENGLRRARG